MLRGSLERLDCVTFVLACCNPGFEQFSETRSVLEYVHRATQVAAPPHAACRAPCGSHRAPPPHFSPWRRLATLGGPRRERECASQRSHGSRRNGGRSAPCAPGATRAGTTARAARRGVLRR
eukprot:2005160-Prymnesium_polylepis.1